MRQERFGKIATGARLEQIRRSANYQKGQFQNQQYTPMMAEDVSSLATMKEALFNRSKRNRPSVSLPSVKSNLLALDPGKDVLVWFGHSSYFIQLDGKKILVDPVFSGHSSPFSFMVKSFKGSDIYTPEELPDIDYLFISHDHWDHLDYETVLKLKSRVKKVITSLGTAAHLERWGFDAANIVELDWHEQAVLDSGFVVTATPARHFSGRGLKRNQALWASFVYQTPHKKIFIGGDSGYDTHFAAIGQKYGPFDLALLECGQYNYAWRYIHMMPEQTVQAAIDLKARILMPVHWAKFALALHAWDEPIIRVTKEANRLNQPIVHPMIGQELNLDSLSATTEWWKRIE
jgi:L-ascorbate metabolism protein UlaG (beta-lactamase superfamily)